jgi:hypothetical protein
MSFVFFFHFSATIQMFAFYIKVQGPFVIIYFLYFCEYKSFNSKIERHYQTGLIRRTLKADLIRL